MTSTVAVQRRGHVAVISLNRPDKMNAVTMAVWEELAEAGEAVRDDPDVRAVVVRGEGRSFCAGLDVSTFEELRNAGAITTGASASDRIRRVLDPVEREPGKITNLPQECAFIWSQLAQPVICAVRGHALGAGLQIAMGADIRFVAPDAKLGLPEIRWGLIPDMSGTATLVRLVGPDVAKEMVWTGRTLTAEEAVRVGLATRVVDDPDAAAFELAEAVSKASPDAIRAGKRLIHEARESSYADAFLAEAKALTALAGTPNQLEAVSAALNRRPASFADPVL